MFFDDDFVMQVGDAPIRYPTAGSGDFFISGFARNEDTLYGTAAVSDEAAGRGRVVLFATDPTFQGMTEGMERILFNAILGNDPVRAASTADGVADRASAVALARKAAEAFRRGPGCR